MAFIELVKYPQSRRGKFHFDFADIFTDFERDLQKYLN